MNIQDVVNQIVASVTDMNTKIDADISEYVSSVQTEINAVVASTNSYATQIQQFTQNMQKDIQNQLTSQLGLITNGLNTTPTTVSTPTIPTGSDITPSVS